MPTDEMIRIPIKSKVLKLSVPHACYADYKTTFRKSGRVRWKTDFTDLASYPKQKEKAAYYVINGNFIGKIKL